MERATPARRVGLPLLAIMAAVWLPHGAGRTAVGEEKTKGEKPVVKQEIVLKLKDGSLLARAKAVTGPQYFLCSKDEHVFLADSRGKVVCPKCGSTQCIRVVDEIDRMMSRSWNFVESMRVKDKPYGHIKWSRSAYDQYNFFASYNAMCSLYKLLLLGYEPPITKEQFLQWRDTFHSWTDPRTGVVEDRLLLKREGRTGNYRYGMCLYTRRAGNMIQAVPRLAGWTFNSNLGGPKPIMLKREGRTKSYAHGMCPYTRRAGWMIQEVPRPAGWTFISNPGGPKPIVALKETREKEKTLPVFKDFKDVESAQKWIEKVKNINSYSFGSTVANRLREYDRFLKENDRRDNGVIEFFHKWLDEHQDPKTGFWGSEKWPLHLGSAGYFKLVSQGGTYRRYGWEPHYRDKVIDTCLSIQDEQGRFGSTDACINWDALKNLRVVSKEIGYYRWDEIRLAAARSVLTVHACWKEDECGFSTTPDRSCVGHCGMKLAPSRDEADMHALTIWTSIPNDILLILLDEGKTP